MCLNLVTIGHSPPIPTDPLASQPLVFFNPLRDPLSAFQFNLFHLSVMVVADSKGSKTEQVTPTPGVDSEPSMSKVTNVSGDSALQFINAEDKPPPLSHEEQEALLRKIDWMLLPILGVVYLLNYLDKVLLNFAAVMVRIISRMGKN